MRKASGHSGNEVGDYPWLVGWVIPIVLVYLWMNMLFPTQPATNQSDPGRQVEVVAPYMAANGL